MEEEIQIINENAKKEKIKNFFVKNSKYLIFSISAIIILILAYFVYLEINSRNQSKLAEEYNYIVNNFNNLTTLELPSGSNCSIILRDVVEEGSSGENVYFDAVRFLNAETSSSLQDTIKGQDNFTMFPLYPNPFNPSISFQYQTNLKSNIFIKIFKIHKFNSIFRRSYFFISICASKHLSKMSKTYTVYDAIISV